MYEIDWFDGEDISPIETCLTTIPPISQHAVISTSQTSVLTSDIFIIENHYIDHEHRNSDSGSHHSSVNDDNVSLEVSMDHDNELDCEAGFALHNDPPVLGEDGADTSAVKNGAGEIKLTI